MASPLPKWLKPPEARTCVALFAGLLWALAFPRHDLRFAAWIAPGLLLLAGLGVRPEEAARLGYVAGLVHFLLSLSWLLNIPFAVGNVAAWISLSAYCALFPAAWLWLCHRTRRWLLPEKGPPLETTAVQSSGIAPVKLRVLTWSAASNGVLGGWWRRQLWIVFAAAAWAGLEFLRGWFLSGFPWNFLGASQYELVPLIQIAAITGVLGVSFVVVLLSCSIAVGVLMVVARPHARFAWKNEVAPALLLLIGLIGWGVNATMKPDSAPSRVLRAALVQPSIPQTLIFDPAANTNRFRQMIALSREALAGDPDLLIWPEAALPLVGRDQFLELQTLIREHETPLILGTDDAEEIEMNDRRQFIYFNAAALFDSHGEFSAVYRKQRLVIFGEYTPFARHLPFLADWFPAGEGFGTGHGPVPFRIEPAGANVTVNICFEDNFADIVRAQVRPDTDFVLNVTNDGWFGDSAAQWQHAANAVFRAVENNVPLVRCTNNGLTCWIDGRGRIRALFRAADGGVYGPGVARFEIPLLEAGATRRPTFYHRHGDWFGWTCLALCGAAFARSLVRGPVHEPESLG